MSRLRIAALLCAARLRCTRCAGCWFRPRRSLPTGTSPLPGRWPVCWSRWRPRSCSNGRAWRAAPAAARRPDLPLPHVAWWLAATALLAIFSVQELFEGALLTSAASAWAGRVAAPLAVVLGALVALALAGASAVVCRAAAHGARRPARGAHARRRPARAPRAPRGPARDAPRGPRPAHALLTEFTPSRAGGRR